MILRCSRAGMSYVNCFCNPEFPWFEHFRNSTFLASKSKNDHMTIIGSVVLSLLLLAGKDLRFDLNPSFQNPSQLVFSIITYCVKHWRISFTLCF